MRLVIRHEKETHVAVSSWVTLFHTSRIWCLYLWRAVLEFALLQVASVPMEEQVSSLDIVCNHRLMLHSSHEDMGPTKLFLGLGQGCPLDRAVEVVRSDYCRLTSQSLIINPRGAQVDGLESDS